ncbi:MAG: 2-isopropylmalate synthase [Candidatus Nitrosopumilus limneticus]|nr:2-isopropylmalate synthase [Candidatus Nitrosopumilus limneticus]MDC4213877.1 2-isopropylmalate synthase [Candidatus Nitrosopumilus limneticus]MDC4218539.1 2-isopropylmalate synthase [Candidatus Nitrosopumilus limneticus]
MQKYKKYITKGINESLSKVPFHKKAPIKRISMLSKKTISESKIHAAVHFVDLNNKKISKYSILHKHDVDEINMILSHDDKLVYEIQLGDEIYKVKSPATIFIPKSLKHRADVISGRGIFVCLIMSNKYKTFKS